MPDINSAIQALSPEEKDEFLQELYVAAANALKSGTPEHVEQLRQILLSWEYTAIVKADSEFVEQLDRDEQEIMADDSPGTDWREIIANLTKGGEKMLKITVTVCRYCEAQRNDFERSGLCSFCNTPLASKEIELPELTDTEKEKAQKYLEDHRGVEGCAGARTPSTVVGQCVGEDGQIVGPSDEHCATNSL